MGAKESRIGFLSYDEAVKRVTDVEVKRLKDAFKRTSGVSFFMTQQCFYKEVLGDGVPLKVAEVIYTSFGGSTKGLHFNNLVVGLVLLTRGRDEEKAKYLFSLFSSDPGGSAAREDMEAVLQVLDGEVPPSLRKCFSEGDKVNYEHFRDWLLHHKEAFTLSRWLLSAGVCVTLTDDSDTPTFYQTLAGVTHLEESDIIDLEKRYWLLKAQSRTGRFDVETFIPLVSPPLHTSLCEGLFHAFDENRDNHIDFKEISCGLSACCRGPVAERQKFCFKVFDVDQDGVLSREEVHQMVAALLEVWKDNRTDTLPELHSCASDIVNAIFNVHDTNKLGCLTLEEYQIWSVNNLLASEFLNLLFQVCHIVLGLRPASPEEEGLIIRGWLEREKRQGLQHQHTWFIMSSLWWQQWKDYTHYEPKSLGVDQGSILTSAADLGWSEATHIANGHVSQQAAQRPAAIDNQGLVASEPAKAPTLTLEGGRLKRCLKKDEDFTMVPEPVWRALYHWYGANLSLPRPVIMDSKTGQAELELFPCYLLFLRHQTATRSSSQTNIWLSMGNVPSPNLPLKRVLVYSACFSRMATIKDIHLYLCQRLGIKEETVRLWLFISENYLTLLDDEDHTLESLKIQDEQQLVIEIRNKDMSWPEEMSFITNSSKMERHKVPTEKGATGLSNLGNTCFMNSSIQCVSNTRPLTDYFTSGRHLYELNRSNPIGMRGHMAKCYGDLVLELWSGTQKNIAPLKLRWTIAKYAPRFNGFQQQDSQELLAFLLDGLHEDLNRVHEKPYVELKDSDGRPDWEVASEAWENHLRRNRSIVVDLFHGQLKSQVKCKTCGHISSRFDPFNFLSLPLPMDSSMHLEITVIKLEGSTPVRYGLRLNMDEKYTGLKKLLSELCDLKPEQILLAEVHGANIKNFPQDHQKVRLTVSTFLCAFEIPVPGSPTSLHSPHLADCSTVATCSTDLHTDPPFTCHEEAVTMETPLVNGLTNGHRHESAVTGYIIAMHRKMMRTELYFLSSQKNRPSLFGMPLIVPCTVHTTKKNLYDAVWRQVSRLVSPLPPQDSSNHAQDCDDSLGYQYPFTLRVVDKDGTSCALCPWYRFCRGCMIACTEEEVSLGNSYISVDWDPTALHLRYQTSQERVVEEHCSVELSRRCQAEPISLQSCLKAFTSEEELGEDELYFCSKCKNHRLATKKLDLWRLPPILIVHLKRFHFVNGRWIKSQKIVKFPMEDFDPSTFLVPKDLDQRLLHSHSSSTFSKRFPPSLSGSSSPKASAGDIKLCPHVSHLSSTPGLSRSKEYQQECDEAQPQGHRMQGDTCRGPPGGDEQLEQPEESVGAYSMVPARHTDDIVLPHTDGIMVPARHTDDIMVPARHTDDIMVPARHTDDIMVPARHTDDIMAPARHTDDIMRPHTDDIMVPARHTDDIMGPARHTDDIIVPHTDDIMVPHTDDIMVPHTDDIMVPHTDDIMVNGVNSDCNTGLSCQQNKCLESIYNLYAISCHSGIMGGGHYVTYAKNPNGKWYCYNDSSCKEVHSAEIDTDSAYILFYEQQEVNYSHFLPRTDGKKMADTSSMDEDFESDYKKYCVLQ
ncbi:ubiquitin carboxyl-terminal hydrolase 32 [Entelurus aequoreus]|uniref:ubiquitin carboxyl-terminal hydrolase 32 n=1 Tax=Entelurus aequoreus TaxID=161455 RepID=UPI002B1D83DC|nr:ubiquitin carboxyl-terminal hydrolase 32 [Entelurus aequoreus]